MVLMMLMSVTVALAGNAKDTQTGNERVKVIIGFVDKPNQNDENMIRGHGGTTKYTYHIIDAKAAEIPERAIARIENNPRVAYVEVDAEVYALEDTLPWGVDRIDAELVWNGTEDGRDITPNRNAGAGVKVAIIDTGIDDDHPDLSVAGGINYVVGSPFDGKSNDEWDDDNGHGTHCAGIVAAVDNEEGVIGVAPAALLHAVKVLSSRGSGYTSDVIAGIEWTMDPNGDGNYSDRMDVISMSFGGGDSTGMGDACDAAYAAGIVLVAAAGNDGDGDSTTNEYSYPAAYGSVIAVGATDNEDDAPSWSNSGPYLELAAPGVGIYSTIPGGYGTKSGTSMACPHVAGTAALVIASDSTLTNVDVRDRLNTTTEDLGPDGWDTVYGHGLVDAENATQPGDAPPVVDIVNPADGSTVSGTIIIEANASDDKGVSQVYFFINDTLLATDTEASYSCSWDTTTVSDGSHTIKVTATDTAEQNASYSIGVTVDNTPPAQVTGLTVTTVSSSQLNLSWNASTDHYNVYRNTTSGGPYELVASPTTNSYSDTGLAASTTYYYTVTAVDSGGNEGSASEEANGTTSEDVANVMHVSNITMWYTTAGPNYFIYTMVTIVDSNEAPVTEATVYLEMTLPDDSKAYSSGSTNGDGTVTFKLKSRQTGEYTSEVTNVVLDGWGYNPEANEETSDSITVP